MKKKLMMMAAALLVGAMSSYGGVVAAWDFTSKTAGTPPAGWTTWSSADISNKVNSTIGAITISDSASGTNFPYINSASIGTTAIWNEQAPALLALTNDAASQAVYCDYVAQMASAGKKFLITISGLTPGQQYQIQFVADFLITYSEQYIDVTQDGVLGAQILPTFGHTNQNRVTYSPYYVFNATESDTDVAFSFYGPNNNQKNGLAGVIVNEVGVTKYILTVNGGTGTGAYEEDAQVAISANAPADFKYFAGWTGDTQYLDNAASSNATVTIPATNIVLTAVYNDIEYAGAVVAAWDFTDKSVAGAAPAGWTTWTTSDMSNYVPSTVGGLTLAFYSAPATTAPSFQVQTSGTLIWSEQAPALVPLTNDAPSQAVYQDFLNSMLSAKKTALTLSGLTVGTHYQIQFLADFMPDDSVSHPAITVTQEGLAADSITYTVGTTGDYRVVYSHYYNFIATETNTDVQFGFLAPNNASKNGLAGMMVKQIGVTSYTLTVNGGDGDGSYSSGAVVDITADAPATGKTFDMWTGDTQYVASVSSANTTVTMPSSAVSVTATYKDIVYALTGSVNGGNGTVSPSSTNVVYNGSADFTVTASSYYRIASLTTNGTAVTGMTFDNNSTSTNLIWSNVLADGAVVATFMNQVANDPAGTPYTWLASYGLTNFNADAAADQDGDGLKTWQEYIAGTDPTSAASTLKVAQTSRNTVTWSPVSGKVYSVYWSTNLVQGFSNLASGITYPQGSYTNPTPNAKVNHYQVRVQNP